jgi:hypothetical protein
MSNCAFLNSLVVGSIECELLCEEEQEEMAAKPSSNDVVNELEVPLEVMEVSNNFFLLSNNTKGANNKQKINILSLF